MIHGHGDDLYKSGRIVRANFSTNVWYEADTEPLRKILSDHMDQIFHYPDPDAGIFRQVAADYHHLEAENILVGNGATELFYLIAHAFAGNNTLLPIPSFTEYEDACTLYNHRFYFLPAMDIHHLPDADFELMFICNPNNPDGRIFSLHEIKAILDYYPDITLVVDESFIHFAPETDSAVSLLADYPNLLIVRSMTKNYAIPGLRLGYMLGDPKLIKFISCYKQPWTVNALAIEAGIFLLKEAGESLPDAVALLERQKQFSASVAAIPGFYPQESHTSFFLVKTDHDTVRLKKNLLEQQGILIRDASNFRGLNNHYFRINTLTEDKNRMLIQALTEYAG